MPFLGCIYLFSWQNQSDLFFYFVPQKSHRQAGLICQCLVIDMYRAPTSYISQTHPSGTGTSSRFWTLQRPLFSSPSFSSSSSNTGSTTAILLLSRSCWRDVKQVNAGIGSTALAPPSSSSSSSSCCSSALRHHICTSQVTQAAFCAVCVQTKEWDAQKICNTVRKLLWIFMPVSE